MADQIPNPKDAGLPTHLYFDTSAGKVAGIFSLTPWGLTTRENSDWEPTTREESKIIEYINDPKYKTYKIDWSKEPIPASELDPADEAAWEHQLVQQWDQGIDIDEEDLKRYAYEINEGPRPELDIPEEDQVNED